MASRGSVLLVCAAAFMLGACASSPTSPAASATPPRMPKAAVALELPPLRAQHVFATFGASPSSLPSPGAPSALAFSPDGRWLAAGGRAGEGIDLYDVRAHRHVGVIAPPPASVFAPAEVTALAFAPSGDGASARLAACGGGVQIVDLVPGTPSTRLYNELVSSPCSLAWSVDGRRLLVARAGSLSLDDVVAGRAIAVASHRPTLEPTRSVSSPPPLFAATAPDGTLFAQSGLARFVADGDELRPRPPPVDGELRLLGASPDGARFVVTSAAHARDPGDVAIVSTAPPFPSRVAPAGVSPDDKAVAADFAPDGERVVLHFAARAPGLYDVATGADLGRLPPSARPVAAFSPDGALVALAQEGRIALVPCAQDGRIVEARRANDDDAAAADVADVADDGAVIALAIDPRLSRVASLTPRALRVYETFGDEPRLPRSASRDVASLAAAGARFVGMALDLAHDRGALLERVHADGREHRLLWIAPTRGERRAERTFAAMSAPTIGLSHDAIVVVADGVARLYDAATGAERGAIAVAGASEVLPIPAPPDATPALLVAAADGVHRATVAGRATRVAPRLGALIAVSHDGRGLAQALPDVRGLAYRDVGAALQRLVPYAPRAGRVLVALSSDGELAALGFGDHLEVVATDTGQRVLTRGVGAPHTVTALAFAPYGFVVSGHADGTVTVWDMLGAERNSAAPEAVTLDALAPWERELFREGSVLTFRVHGEDEAVSLGGDPIATERVRVPPTTMTCRVDAVLRLEVRLASRVVCAGTGFDSVVAGWYVADALGTWQTSDVDGELAPLASRWPTLLLPRIAVATSPAVAVAAHERAGLRCFDVGGARATSRCYDERGLASLGLRADTFWFEGERVWPRSLPTPKGSR